MNELFSDVGGRVEFRRHGLLFFKGQQAYFRNHPHRDDDHGVNLRAGWCAVRGLESADEMTPGDGSARCWSVTDRKR
jgi:hypothetical protein